MFVFCCCRPRQDDHEDAAAYPELPTAIPLPILPPPAKLSDTRLCESLTPSNIVHLQPNHRQDTANSLQSLGAASSTPSLMPNHESIELGQLVVEDSDSEGEPTETPVHGKKTSSPLDVVRTKFIRNRSHQASRRRPTASHGSSEEEIARRAELKRIMHKRIQEELKNEEEQPERSLESVPSAKHPPSPIELPGGGPRDNLEFSMIDASLVDSDARKPATGKVAGLPNEPIKDDKGKENTQDRRRSSCPQSFSFSTPGGLATQVVLRERNSLPDIPPSPTIRPVKQLDAQNTPSLKSWRLSTSASHLDKALSSDTVISHRTASQPSNSPDGNSALGTWLMTQGLSSREPSLGKLTDPVSDPAVCVEQGHFGPQQPKAIARSDLQALLNMYTVDLPKNFLDEDFDGQSKTPRGSKSSLKTSGMGINPSTGVGVSDVSAAGAYASSSVYPSMGSTRLPTPRISTTDNEIVRGTTSLHGLQLSPFKWLGMEGDNSSLSSDLMGRGNGSNYSLVVPTISSSRRPTAGAGSSLAVSETSSYRHREAELQTIEKRFGDVLSKRGPPLPKHSKFREEFDKTGPPVAITRSSFLLQKLHIPVPKRSKSGSKIDAKVAPRIELVAETSGTDTSRHNEQHHNQSPSISGVSGMRTPSSNVYLTPTLEESATDLWQRAVQLERESREAKTRAAAAKSEKKKLASNGSVHLKVGRWKGTRRSRSVESANMPDTTTHSAGRVSAEVTSNRHAQIEPPSWLARKWTARASQEEEPIGDHKNIGNSGKHAFRTADNPTAPPESWSRWPSQTRARRTATAGSSDSVKSRDFAVVASADDGRTAWVTNKHPGTTRTVLQLGSRSFSGKLGKAVKSGFGKLLPPKSGLIDEVGKPLNGPAALVVGRQLDYPELEILPTEGGYKELKALEQGIETMRNPQRLSPTAAQTMAKHKASISHTIPILVRAAEHEGHDCKITAAGIHEDRLSITTPINSGRQARPVTPAYPMNRKVRDSMISANDFFATPPTSRLQARRVRDSTMTTGTTERYATPRSRMSRSPSLRSPSSKSEMSNSPVIRRCRSATDAGRSRHNFSTCRGRSVTQPEMLKSTIEFKEELERRLKTQKRETYATARSSVDAECSEHTLPPC